MQEDLLKILGESNKEIDNQQLMNYISGKMSASQQHDFEEELLNSELLDDAVEGLESFGDKNRAALFAEDLNRKLKENLKKKKLRSAKRKIGGIGWIVMIIVVVLALAVIAYLVINGHLHSN